MPNYKIIYPFEVIDNVMGGAYVGVLDRETKAVYDVRTLSVSALANMLSYTDTKNRYEFWIEEKNDESI